MLLIQLKEIVMIPTEIINSVADAHECYLNVEWVNMKRETKRKYNYLTENSYNEIIDCERSRFKLTLQIYSDNKNGNL